MLPPLSEVLGCYKPDCRYLQEFSLTADDQILGVGTFAIAEPAYIESTGHLNAVETTLCFNQMLYATLAALIAQGDQPCFERWSMDDFWRKQLADVLIAEISTQFKAPINPLSFTGELSVSDLSTARSGTLWMTLPYSFHDEHGACTGKATVAMVGS